MRKIFSIAINIVFKEGIRNKVIVSLIVSAFFIILLSVFLDPIALGETERIVKDVGLSSISFFSLIIVLLSGTKLISHEIEKKTIYLIVSKPILKRDIILGKFFGLLSIIWSVGLSAGIFLILIMLVFHIQFNITVFIAIFFILLQFSLLSSIVIFFSTFVSPTLTGFFSIMLYIIGFLIKDLSFFIVKTHSVFIKFFIRSLMLIIPNFYYLDIKLFAVHNTTISLHYFIFALFYSIIYITLFLYISFILFENKEF